VAALNKLMARRGRLHAQQSAWGLVAGRWVGAAAHNPTLRVCSRCWVTPCGLRARGGASQ